MSYKLRFLPDVPQDISGACAWYEARRAGLAQAFLKRLEEVLARVACSPELHAAGYRSERSARLKRFPYVVRYSCIDDTVLVIAILHSKRHSRTWQERL